MGVAVGMPWEKNFRFFRDSDSFKQVTNTSKKNRNGWNEGYKSRWVRYRDIIMARNTIKGFPQAVHGFLNKNPDPGGGGKEIFLILLKPGV